MRCFSQIHVRLRLAAFEAPSSSEDWVRLRAFAAGQIPQDYEEWIQVVAEMKLVWEAGCFRIWGAAGCVEMNGAYEIQRHFPGALAIGDNEAGEVLIWRPDAVPPGLYRSGLGDLDPGAAVWICGSLDALLMDASGVERLG